MIPITLDFEVTMNDVPSFAEPQALSKNPRRNNDRYQ